MTSDTTKSLDYLKKSLKMSKRAVEKNMKADGTSQAEIDEYKAGCDELLALIEKWETKQAVDAAASAVATGAASSFDPSTPSPLSISITTPP